MCCANFKVANVMKDVARNDVLVLWWLKKKIKKSLKQIQLIFVFFSSIKCRKSNE